ncbi:DHFS-FPGS homolog D [Striga asiatica]|uniref:DHFS-FPGS homolog D n=1 Tax=Striga asiatica TaxID=4170 RepID=A0A5A7QQQ0_STRAF|nr:DHFS-FPGS homolog D [Striga asiatica]
MHSLICKAKIFYSQGVEGKNCTSGCKIFYSQGIEERGKGKQEREREFNKSTLILLWGLLGRTGGAAAAAVDEEAAEEELDARSDVKMPNPRKRRKRRRMVTISWIHMSHGTLKLSMMNSSPNSGIAFLHRLCFM